MAAAEGAAATSRVAGRAQTWSPDGERLAYTAAGNLLVASAGAGEPGRVVVEGARGLRAPSWSPDGETLAFYSTASGSQDIWLVDAAGATPPRQLTSGAAEADDSRFSPMWSPDGRWIAYISNRADWWHDDVWLVGVASGDAHRVSASLMASSSPVWSPGGSSLVLMGTSKDEYWYEDLAYLYRIDLDLSGTAPRVVREAPLDMQVYATDAIMRFDPFWSGDGERIYFPVPAARRLRPVVRPRRGRRRHAGHECRRVPGRPCTRRRTAAAPCSRGMRRRRAGKPGSSTSPAGPRRA